MPNAIHPFFKNFIMIALSTFRLMSGNDVFGIVVSFAFLLSVLAVAKLILHSVDGISPEVVRKFIHIGVSNWWFILITCFDSFGAKLVAPG